MIGRELPYCFREEFIEKFQLWNSQNLAIVAEKNVERYERFVDQGLCYAYSLSLLAQENPDPKQLEWSQVRFLQRQHDINCHISTLSKRVDRLFEAQYPQMTRVLSKRFQLDSEEFQKRAVLLARGMRHLIACEERISRQMKDEFTYWSPLVFPINKWFPTLPGLKKLGLEKIDEIPLERIQDQNGTFLDFPDLIPLQDKSGEYVLSMKASEAGHAIYLSLDKMLFCDSNHINANGELCVSRFSSKFELLESLMQHICMYYPFRYDFFFLEEFRKTTAPQNVSYQVEAQTVSWNFRPFLAACFALLAIAVCSHFSA